MLSALLATASPALSAVASAAVADEPQQVLLSATVNGVADATPLVLLRGAGNRVYAAPEQIAAWRLRTSALPSITRDGRPYYLLNAIPGATVAIDEASQELRLTVPAAILAPSRIAYANVESGDAAVSGTGAFLNYDLNAESSDGETRLGGAFETGLFTPRGVGIARFVARAGGRDSGFVRLESNWTIDDPARMRSLRLGDSVTTGGVGGRPVRFAGIQLARNFAVQPGFITFPLPSLSGSAEIPSVVDVYVNDQLARSANLPPGPFDITDIPVVTGNGEVQLVVRDMLGRQQLVSRPYYASLTQLRRGLDDYSYELGLLRRSFGIKSGDYGSLMFSGSHRYGFSDALTGEAHVEVTAGAQQGGIGGSLALAHVGQIEATVAGSRSQAGNGISGSVSFERRTRGLSLGLQADLTSTAYRTVGARLERRPPKAVLQAFAGLPLGGSSIGLSYIRRDARGDEPDTNLASASWSIGLARIGSLNLAVRDNLGGKKDRAAEALLVLPLGARTSASTSASFDQGSARLASMLQRSLPIGNGLGYRFSTAMGRFKRIEGLVSVRTSFADYDAQLTWIDGKTGLRLSTAGSIGIAGGAGFVSRRIDQSFARVKVGDYEGIRVYADNQLVGRTGKHGSILVPNLRPYERNVVRIDADDLPLDAELDSAERTVRPRDRSGVQLDFGARPARAELLQVKLDNGTFLPSGSVVRLNGRTDEFVSAPGGEVYLTGLADGAIAVAQWADGSCQFGIHLSATANQAPRAVQCRALAQ